MRIYVTPRFLFHLYGVLIGIPLILALLFRRRRGLRSVPGVSAPERVLARKEKLCSVLIAVRRSRPAPRFVKSAVLPFGNGRRTQLLFNLLHNSRPPQLLFNVRRNAPGARRASS